MHEIRFCLFSAIDALRAVCLHSETITPSLRARFSRCRDLANYTIFLSLLCMANCTPWMHFIRKIFVCQPLHIHIYRIYPAYLLMAFAWLFVAQLRCRWLCSQRCDLRSSRFLSLGTKKRGASGFINTDILVSRIYVYEELVKRQSYVE